MTILNCRLANSSCEDGIPEELETFYTYAGKRQIEMYIHLVVVFLKEAVPREMLLEFAHVETYWIMFSKYSKFHASALQKISPIAHQFPVNQLYV